MTRLLLVRHGESIWNADGRWQGQADPPLSERGQEQAAAAAASLGTVDALVTSDLERAADTGAIIGRILGIDPVLVEPRLRERDAGSLSGLTRPEIHEAFPGLLPDDPGGFRPAPDGQPNWPADWESDGHLWERVEVALLALGRLVPDGDVVAITHGGVMYAIERRLGAPDRGRLSNLGAVWLEVVDDQMTVGPRLDLIDPATATAIEADRILTGGAVEVDVIRSPKRRKTAQARIVAGRLEVRIPARSSKAEERRLVEVFRRRYERAGTSTSLDLTTRAKKLAKAHDLPVPTEIRWVTNQAHRWGSCTPSTGVIRISDRMADFPLWVVDHVIVHELAHLVERHHGPAFYALANRYPLAERAEGYLLAKTGGDAPDADALADDEEIDELDPTASGSEPGRAESSEPDLPGDGRLFR